MGSADVTWLKVRLHQRQPVDAEGRVFAIALALSPSPVCLCPHGLGLINVTTAGQGGDRLLASPIALRQATRMSRKSGGLLLHLLELLFRHLRKRLNERNQIPNLGFLMRRTE